MSRLLAWTLGLSTLPPSAPAPAENPTTAEKIALGRRLFFDPLLSQDRTVSCSSCHDPAHAFSDPAGQPVSPGVEGRLGRRNAVSLVNVGDRHALTWSGASPSLETQAMIPLGDHAELNMTPGEVAARGPGAAGGDGPGPRDEIGGRGRGLRVGAETVVTVDLKKAGAPLSGCRCRVLLYKGTPSARVPPVQDLRLSALQAGTGRVPLKVDAPGSYTLVLDGRPPTPGTFDAFRLRHVLEAE